MCFVHSILCVTFCWSRVGFNNIFGLSLGTSKSSSGYLVAKKLYLVNVIFLADDCYTHPSQIGFNPRFVGWNQLWTRKRNLNVEGLMQKEWKVGTNGSWILLGFDYSNPTKILLRKGNSIIERMQTLSLTTL